jgi:methylenetetrahydrofolate dehydrogenase (NADP+)/methenyltetrahydrofolate cyclohydrolase
MKIDGRQIAQEILSVLKERIAKQNVKPHLAIIIIGNNPASLAYVKQKELRAKDIGSKTTLISLAPKTREDELIAKINELNSDKTLHGIIVQKPLPKHMNNDRINLSITPEKDIDGFTANSKFDSPIGLAVLEILKKLYKDFAVLKNKKIVILGKGETGGKPIKQAFLKLDVDPIVVDSKTQNPEKIIKTSDIVISAVGKKEVIKPNMLKKSAVLIGAGQHIEEDGQFHGDYEEEKIKDIASFYTITPGGIGPVNVAMLLKNLLKATEIIWPTT